MFAEKTTLIQDVISRWQDRVYKTHCSYWWCYEICNYIIYHLQWQLLITRSRKSHFLLESSQQKPRDSRAQRPRFEPQYLVTVKLGSQKTHFLSGILPWHSLALIHSMKHKSFHRRCVVTTLQTSRRQAPLLRASPGLPTEETCPQTPGSLPPFCLGFQPLHHLSVHRTQVLPLTPRISIQHL